MGATSSTGSISTNIRDNRSESAGGAPNTELTPSRSSIPRKTMNTPSDETSSAEAPQSPPQETIISSEHFINRESSWLEFNARVLEEAQDETNPLLERVKFLSIFSSNLDEFFMVRVAGLREQAFGDGAPQDQSPDSMPVIEQLQYISLRTRELVSEQSRCWNESVLPALAESGVRILSHDKLDKTQCEELDRFFDERAFPILTPMAIDPSHPTPRFHNRGLYLAAMMKRTSGLGPSRLATVVQLPQVLPRLVPLANSSADCHDFVLLEEVIAARLPNLFGGYKTQEWTTFRITRDMDIDLLDREGDDLLRLIEERLRARQRTQAVRLEVSAGASEKLLDHLIQEEDIHLGSGPVENAYSEIYYLEGPLDMTAFFSLAELPGLKELRDPTFVPASIPGLGRGDDLFAQIARKDILLHHPYDSFDPVVDFIERAAFDPQVLAIKQTLYRTSGDSPIVRALINAAENGKHVTALVELKARFDEANNVNWARQMERAGVHVVFGFMDLKTHCKLSLIVRQEGSELKRYVHLGTGNYNPTTALLYTDTGLFTADKRIANDATALFNLLTGYSQGHDWKRLVIAPNDLQRRTIELIDEQAQRAKEGKKSRIFAKLNALVDRQTIEALYRASQAGVPIDLVVRGICCLRPGLPGVSETIRVRSIVDRFLEHSRIMVFGQDKRTQVFFSSADWMPRNFRRRVEVMFPIEDESLKAVILEEILPTYLRDNVKARELQPDGSHIRVGRSSDESAHRCQLEFLEQHAAAAAAQAAARGLLADKADSRSARSSSRRRSKSKGK